MKSTCGVLIAITVYFCGICFTMAQVSITPKPWKMTIHDGGFVLNESTTIHYQHEGDQNTARILAEWLRPATGFPFKLVKGEGNTNAILLIRDEEQRALGEEGYKLAIEPTRIVIKAPTRTGVFYGTMSLFQALPAKIVSRSLEQRVAWSLPCLSIVDKPRFSWRAFMLDESRHFKGAQVVKSLLDQMARLKMNVFHWHLVDDQGWRIEIKKYPKLTEIGSKRKDTQIGGWNSPKRSGQPHSGFYTQDQIRDIVSYAQNRMIRIVPEIEMPGHASASVAAYPQLGTVSEQIEVPVTFGKLPSSYNVADEKVYQVLSDILDEVAGLFPGEVIHIGGDEVKFDQWKASSDIKALMEREGLATMADVQIYFTNRMSRIIEAKGRRMMGWNEILGDDLHGFLKGGQTAKNAALAKNAVIHFWKGSPDLMEKALVKGHEVVNSTHQWTYLDYDFDSERAYSFNPAPADLPADSSGRVIGFGCQMWSEWIPSVERLHEQVFPRLAAYAEVGWTTLENKNYSEFWLRLKSQLARWDIEEVAYKIRD